MSEPVLKQRSTVDLDDFERRLRQATSAPGHREDPLAELARLVGEPYDPFGDVFAAESAAPGGHGRRDDARLPGFPEIAAPSAGAPAVPGFAADVPRLFGDFSAIEAGLRGSIEGSGAPQHGFDAVRQDSLYVQGGQLPLDNEGEHAGAAPGEGIALHAHDGYHQGNDGQEDIGGYVLARNERGAMRRPMVLMAASIAVGVIGIGSAFALKGRVASSPREVKTIMADATPTKIQPPVEAAPDAADAAVAFGKNGSAQPTRLVSREEQPIDVGQAVQDNVARAARAPTPTDAASVPVPPPPGQAGQARGAADPIGAQVQGFGLGEMPAPKRVKVVAVRPDGSIVPGGEPAHQEPTAARDAAGKDAAAKDAASKAAAKSTSRVAAKASEKLAEEMTIEQAAAGADEAAKPVRKGKAQRVASADAEAAAPEATAEGGNFAVQLAAPTSEGDAKAASTRLSKKFGEALGGRRIAIRKAESNGKSVYRVRVSSLSRNEATSLCDKLKADGGSCFVAKN